VYRAAGREYHVRAMRFADANVGLLTPPYTSSPTDRISSKALLCCTTPGRIR
jgi:hypothetical protein